jgi:hypothetical protein
VEYAPIGNCNLTGSALWGTADGKDEAGGRRRFQKVGDGQRVLSLCFSMAAWPRGFMNIVSLRV